MATFTIVLVNKEVYTIERWGVFHVIKLIVICTHHVDNLRNWSDRVLRGTCRLFVTSGKIPYIISRLYLLISAEASTLLKLLIIIYLTHPLSTFRHYQFKFKKKFQPNKCTYRLVVYWYK